MIELSILENKRKILYILTVLIAIGMVYYTQFYEAESVQYGDVSVYEAKDLIEEKPKLVILDVRTVSEYNDAHIEGAINIPVQELEERVNELSKNDELLIYCRTGNKSSQAVSILKSYGYTKIFHMTAGITGWKNAGYPTV